MAYEASEIMTAVALQYSTKELVEVAKAGTQAVVDLIDSSRSELKKSSSAMSKKILFGDASIQKGFTDKMVAKNAADMVVGMSAATGIRKYMGIGDRTTPTVYMTGNKWPKDVQKFEVSAYGFKDYNSADILVSSDKKKFFGISLKKKGTIQSVDPTLINKAFDTLLDDPTNLDYQKLKKSLSDFREEYFADVVFKTTQTKPPLIRWQDINDSSGNKFKKESDFKSWAKSDAGKKELFRGAKRDQKIFKEYNYVNMKGSAQYPKDGYNWKPSKSELTSYRGDASVRKFINKDLAAQKNPLWQKFISAMSDNAEVFSDTLINVILKKYLYDELEKKDLDGKNFSFALVTGIGNIRGTKVNVLQPKVVALQTTLCGLDEIEETYKRQKYEIVLDEKKKDDSDAAKIFFNLVRGGLTLLNLELRYKGDFNPQPQFQGGVSEQFNKLIIEKCVKNNV